VSLLVAILALGLVAAVVAVVSAPLRRRGLAERQGSDADGMPATDAALDAFAHENARHELEAAREAKYREIRDAELDYRTGKLSRADYESIDAELRAQAIEILNRLDPDAESGEGV
jgi:hypothetical protein